MGPLYCPCNAPIPHRPWSNPPNHQESINVRIWLDSWRLEFFFNPFLMFYDSITKRYETGKTELRIFALFGWIRPESPRHCVRFTTRYHIVKRAVIGSKGGWKLCTIIFKLLGVHDWSIIKLGNILYLLDG